MIIRNLIYFLSFLQFSYSLLNFILLNKFNFFPQGSILDAHRDTLLHRLRGLCDNAENSPESFNDYESVYALSECFYTCFYSLFSICSLFNTAVLKCSLSWFPRNPDSCCSVCRHKRVSHITVLTYNLSSEWLKLCFSRWINIILKIKSLSEIISVWY